MKKLISISFLVFFLFANTELGQLVRFPVLIHHFLEHTALNQQESFLDFINDHYQNEIDHPDDEHGDHQRLPFKTATNSCVQTPLILEEIRLDIPFLMTFDCPLKSEFIHHSNLLSTDLLAIWQPPRTC